MRYLLESISLATAIIRVGICSTSFHNIGKLNKKIIDEKIF